MKKIVALVLSLVMVLGLATTAFAATTSTGSVATTSVTPVKAELYDLATVAGQSMALWSDEITDIDLTTVSGKIKNDVPMYVPNIYVIAYTAVNDTTYAGDVFLEVAKADATYALKNNGAWTYLYYVGPLASNPLTGNTGVIETKATAIVIDAKVPVADEDVDCGDCFAKIDHDNDPSTATVAVPAAYYVSGDDTYYVGGTTFAYFNGEFVGISAIPFDANGGFKTHNWDPTTVVMRGTDAKGHDIPVAITCEDCEKTFTVVPAYMFDNTWVEDVDYQDYLTGGYFVVLKAAATTTPDADAGDKVESAETFDAGIAMYVGMSVMAAAGSAVVLKKKD